MIFHNLKGYDSYLIFKELSRFNNLKISIIPNGLEKYMTFTVNKNLVFIDSMQYVNSSLDKLVKNLNSVKLESGFISFKNYSKQIPVPFKIYADFECILEKVDGDIECISNSSDTRKP